MTLLFKKVVMYFFSPIAPLVINFVAKFII